MKIKIPFTDKFLNLETSSLRNPKQWLVDWFNGGSASKSGATVNERTALQVTAFLAGVKILAESVASLPLITYQKLEPRGKARAPNHPVYEVLHDIANEEMPAFQLRETIQGHAVNWGNGYAEIQRDGGGRVRGLWPLLPDRTWPERDPKTQKLRYRTTLMTGEQVILPFENVLHIPGFGFDGIVGYNPVILAKEAIGLSLATEEFGANFFGQGATPSGIVEYPDKLKEEAYQRYKKDVRTAHEGLSKSHRLMILEQGLKYHQVTIPPEAAQFLETRKFQVTEIARMLRIPPHMLAEMDKATFSNIEQQSLDFVVNSLRAWLVRWEQMIKMKLFTRADRAKGFFSEHLVDGLLRGDIKSRYEAYAIARQNGWYSVNDIREKENENPVAGGDTYSMNGSFIPIDSVAQGGENNSG